MKKLLTIGLIIFAVWGLYQLADNTHDPANYPEVATTASSTNTSESTGSNRYAGDGFSFSHTDSFGVVAAGESLPEAARGYIPACGDGGGNYNLCTYYAGDDFAETNFATAGVSFRYLPEVENQQACREGELLAGSETRTEQEIDGRQFTVFTVNDAATSHYAEDRVYRSWLEDRCFEATARISSTSLDVYPEGEREGFSDEMREQLRTQLSGVVESLQFTTESNE